ncbi:MAG: PEP/pyruvate-binding domain-containing protein [Bdellovibrionota bacterium]
MILPLTSETPADAARLGGKGAGLVRLLKAGLPIPEAWCLTAGHPSGKTLEKELRSFWEEFEEKHPGSRLAVRSSAVAEDRADASFAGVYETVLDVKGEKKLLAAVRKCLAAAGSARAKAYRGKREDRRIALVFQRMLAPTRAGVLLTENPERPFAGEMTLEAVWGQGEALVSGKVSPDRFVLEKKTGRILSLRIGAKEAESVYVPGKGHELRPVPAKRRKTPCLLEKELRLLWEFGKKAENFAGRGQDLEWAFDGLKLYALQLRPIVGLPPENPEIIWSRRFGDEYLADYTMPLSDTLLTRWITEDYLRDFTRLLGNEEAARTQAFRRYHGYIYISGAYVSKMLRAAPPAFRRMDSIDWFPAQWVQKAKDEPFEPRLLIGSLLAPLRDPRGALRENPKVLERHCRNVESKIPPLLRQDYQALSLESWRGQFDEVYALGQEHFRIIRWGMSFYNPMLHAALQRVLREWAGDDSGEAYRAAIGGLSGTKTAEIGRDVWRLSQAARQEKKLAESIRKGIPLKELHKKFKASAFWPVFEVFLSRHGHRAASREISQPRWREMPEAVLGFVAAQLQGAPPDPAEAEGAAAGRARKAREEALRKAGRGAGGFFRRRFLSFLFEQTETYTRYRENQRYYLDYLLFHVRLLVLELGRRLVEKGVLGTPEEVFFLESEELWPLLEQRGSFALVRKKIEERRQDYLLWKNRLPATYLFDNIEVELDTPSNGASQEEASAGGVVRGLPSSGGRSKGVARVVLSLSALGTVRPGDILVTSNTDPGWTTVFPLLAGLVTETGGTLSHGALLAREYGIPAVTGVRGATSQFKTGDVVEIDGHAGTLKWVE